MTWDKMFCLSLKNGMQYFVEGVKNGMQCFVEGVKNGMQRLVHGMFCLAPILLNNMIGSWF